MEGKAVDDVEREKREAKEGGREEEEEEVDATGVTSMLLLLLLAARNRRRWKKVSETRRKVAKQPHKLGNTGQPGGSERLAVVLVHFINEQGSVSC